MIRAMNPIPTDGHGNCRKNLDNQSPPQLEINLLVESVKSRTNVIENKNTDSLVNRTKKSAWVSIEKGFRENPENPVSGFHSTLLFMECQLEIIEEIIHHLLYRVICLSTQLRWIKSSNNQLIASKLMNLQDFISFYSYLKILLEQQESLDSIVEDAEECFPSTSGFMEQDGSWTSRASHRVPELPGYPRLLPSLINSDEPPPLYLKIDLKDRPFIIFQMMLISKPFNPVYC
uniref:Regulatory protein zeste n=1 Tax=Romanomermis culicivorax TaxID=13658 RepID=A0A915K2Z6_ROMCU